MIVISTQTVSLVDFVKKVNTKLPAHCLTTDKNNRCTSCEDGYEISKGSCVSVSGAVDGSECEGKDSCSEAKTFNSEQ